MKPQEALEMGKSFELSRPGGRAVWRSWSEAERGEYIAGTLEAIRLLGYVQFEKNAAAEAARTARLS